MATLNLVHSASERQCNLGNDKVDLCLFGPSPDNVLEDALGIWVPELGPEPRLGIRELREKKACLEEGGTVSP